jgi:hypothetical protein
MRAMDAFSRPSNDGIIGLAGPESRDIPLRDRYYQGAFAAPFLAVSSELLTGRRTSAGGQPAFQEEGNYGRLSTPAY